MNVLKNTNWLLGAGLFLLIAGIGLNIVVSGNGIASTVFGALSGLGTAFLVASIVTLLLSLKKKSHR